MLWAHNFYHLGTYIAIANSVYWNILLYVLKLNGLTVHYIGAPGPKGIKGDVGSPGVDGKVEPTGRRGKEVIIRIEFLQLYREHGPARAAVVCHCAYTKYHSCCWVHALIKFRGTFIGLHYVLTRFAQ